ncbi:hypothetical protein [Epibacterium ulvae]|uniref:hypothetical protein n=1 Tax=Epibacterium ulvae TaxID=1156985 RepID=UPI00248FA709|nr:hypothetical protein [Epibacterium ulvae]
MSQDLYSLHGATPQPLPQQLKLPNGRWRTPPFADADLAAAGYVKAPAKPSYRAQSERVIWQDGAWRVEPLAARAPRYKALTKLETMGLFRQITGMDDAGELALREDPALKLLWMKWETDVPQSIHREHPVVGVFLDGLIATGHATPDQKNQMLAAWPQI